VKTEHYQQRRQQSAGTAQPEVGEPDPAALLPLGQQQRGDEEAGEDEERVHPEEAARQPGDAAVEEQYPATASARTPSRAGQ
jgi:hypothetical protein